MTSTSITGAKKRTAYRCGPVTLNIAFEDSAVQEALHGLLSQYDAPWASPETILEVTIERAFTMAPAAEPAGSYFQSLRLRVDRRGDTLFSLSKNGVWMEFDLANNRASIVLPDHHDWAELIEETEQQLVLLLARAWAQAGWTPLHAGSLLPPGDKRCVLLCAPSGVGKTTLTTALLLRGWRTLGDDKTLARTGKEGVIVRALARQFHLHPESSRWFPGIGDISAWPRYSRWTEKRSVRMSDVWPHLLLDEAVPAAVVLLERSGSGLVVEPLDRMSTLNTLLRQVAIPSDAAHARQLLSCVASLAAQVNSAVMKVANEAYAESSGVDSIEDALRRLLA